MSPQEKTERSIEVQADYAAGRIGRAAAWEELLALVGNEDLADEILGQIDGDDDVVVVGDEP